MISRILTLSAALTLSCSAALAGSSPAAPAPGWWVETPQIMTAHSLCAAVGGSYTADAPFPYSGLSGDLTDYGWLEARLAPSDNIELFTHGVIRRALSVESISQLSGGPELQQPVALGQTRSVTGDFSLYAKWRAVRRGGVSAGLLFGFTMPNANVRSGLGLDVGGFHGRLLGAVTQGRWRADANLGIAIINDPTLLTGQDDFFTYGAAIALAVSDEIDLGVELYGVDGPDDGAQDGLFDSTNIAATVGLSAREYRLQLTAVAYLSDTAPSHAVGIRFSRTFALRP